MNSRRMLVFAVLAVLTVSLAWGSVSAERPDDRFINVVIGFETAVNHQLLAARGIDVNHQFTNFPAVTATMPESALKGLSRAPGIAYVHEDGAEYALLSQSIPWGVDRVRAQRFYHSGQFGAGIKVAVLDTGIDPTHRDIDVYGGANFAGSQGWWDDHGHGTHVAGTIAALNNTVDVVGVGPDIHLYSVKVLDHNGWGTASGVAAGIDWSISNSMRVINMSLGFHQHYAVVEQACQAAWNAGILLVAAAGNDGYSSSGNIGYPAKYATVMAVGASTPDNFRASFSSTGPELDLVAPGSSIQSLNMGGGLTTMSGTSMASPHVAGAAALLMKMRPGWSNQTVRSQLVNNAVTIGDGDPHKYGSGLLNAYLAAPRLNVTVTTDKSWYTRMETIVVTVDVRSNWGYAVANSQVVLEAHTPCGYVFTYTGTTGTFGKAYFNYVAYDAGITTFVARAYHTDYLYGFNWVDAIVLDDDGNPVPPNPKP